MLESPKTFHRESGCFTVFVPDRCSAGDRLDGGHSQNWTSNLCQAGEREFAELMEHVNRDDHACDGGKGSSEKKEGHEEFADEIDLSCGDNGQEIPEPNAAPIAGGCVRDGVFRA